MAKVVYKSYNRNEGSLFPVYLSDMVGAEHPARVVDAVVDFVKYNMFHAEDRRRNRQDPFLPGNMFYNAEQDFYVCPRGQHLEHVRDERRTSDLGYVSTVSRYRAANCAGCPFRGMCHKGKGDRIIEANHRANAYRARAKVQPQ